MPADLAWFPHEKTWRTVAAARIERHVRHLRLALESTEDYGIDAGLAAKLHGIGVEIGGEFRSLSKTRWDMEAWFDG